MRTHIKKYIIFIGMLLAATVSSSYCLAADFSNNALCSSGTIEPNLVPEVRVYSHFKNSTSKNTADVNSEPIFLPKGCGLSPGAVRSIVGNVEGEVVQVFDVLGREHLNEVIVKNKLAVDKLDSGLYFLKINSQVQRLIIK